MDDATRTYIDAKTETTRAQNDARFAEVLSTLKIMQAEIASKPGTWALVSTVFGAMITGVIALVAILSFAGDRFDGGLSLADQRQEQLERDRQQDETVRRLDAIIGRLDAQSAASPPPTSASNN